MPTFHLRRIRTIIHVFLAWSALPLIFNWGHFLCSGDIFVQVGQYPARIYSQAPPGVPIVKVTAYENTTVPVNKFELEKTGDASYFRIGSDGVIKTDKKIIFDVGRVFEFYVYAHHEQTAESKHVRIIVSERNRYSPRFGNSTYVFPVYRYGVGDTIGVVSATDNDEESYNKEFNIEAQAGQTALNYVDVGRTGILKLKRRVPESVVMLDVTVTATDMGSPTKSGTAVISIDVLLVKHPDTFCLSTTQTTSTLCWKNPMPERDFAGYIVTVQGNASRTDTIPLLAGHAEACYTLEGTTMGSTYVFTVKADTSEFWHGRDLDLVHKKAGIGASASCVTEGFSTCSYRNPCKNGGTCNHNGILEFRADTGTTALDYSCLCVDGWSGYNCTVQNVCGSNPCGDFGSCIRVGDTRHQCQCYTGYFGDKCQHFNMCLKEPCMNGGLCSIADDGNYTCQCLNNFSGNNCENPDPCTPDPCTKGQGRCIVISENMKECRCRDGFYGEHCENEDQCVTLQPCLSGGKCVTTQVEYTCQCPTGKMGQNCQFNDPCAVKPCQNNGVCSVSDENGYLDYSCQCLTNYFGTECQYQRDTSCLGVNCNNGTCVADRNQENRCDCNLGFHGEYCQHFNVCVTLNNACSGRGTCVSEASTPRSDSYTPGYSCECQPRYYGQTCEQTNMCYPKTCQDAERCEIGDGGQYDCVAVADACNPNRCLNNGKCSAVNATDYLCSCSGDWIGKNCKDQNPCASKNNPCKNGSSCSVIGLTQEEEDAIGQKYDVDCQCPTTRIGKYCQLNNPCQAPHCVNGNCVLTTNAKDVTAPEIDVDYTSLFKCQCSPGYTGQLCDRKSCQGVICANGGTCSNGECLCPPQFTGPLCQTSVAECVDGDPLDDPTCYCQGGHILCRINDCEPGQIEFSPTFGDKFCINETNVNVSASAVFDIVIRCCYKVCELYQPTCDTRTHCSPNNQPDTVCQYFNSQCQGDEQDCAKFAEEEMSCLDLSRKGDRKWMECATQTLLSTKEGVKNPSSLTASQVTSYADTVVGQIGAALEDTMIAQIALEVVDHLSDVNVSVSREAERNNGTNKRLRSFLEDYTARVSLGGGNVSLATNGLVLQASTFDAFQNGDITFNPSFEDSSPSGLSISLPRQALESMKYNLSKESRLQFLSYKKSQLFTPKYGDDDLITVNDDVIDGQRVISASVAGLTVRDLTEPVRIVLPAIDKGVNHTCVFWDEANSSWSDRGVHTVHDPQSGTFTCLSNHLTSFAVIMSPTPEALRSEIGLVYITYIGSGISMGCLLLTILTYGLFRCLHGEKSGKILLHLCTSLLLLNVVFLVGSVDVSDYSDDVCTAIAILLHYFVMSSLWWMLVEGIEMYRAIVTVFTKYERFYMVKRCLVGWGIPVIIVAATASVDISYYGINTVDEEGQEDTKICFMTPGGDNIAYYTSLLAPACLIVLINAIIFILIARVILRPRFQQQISSNTAPFTPAQVRGAFTVMFLLGVTWIFGPLAIGKAAIVFSYLFCISNSLQGCLIFVFRCLFNPEARLAWIQLFKTGTLKRRRGPIKSKYVDSSSSKDGLDSSRRLSNSANMNLTTSTNYTSGHNSSMKLPLFRGSGGGGIHAHPHQLHTTNGWHPNLNGLKRDKECVNVSGNDCGVSVSVSSGSGSGVGGDGGSYGDGSDLIDMNSVHSSRHDQSVEKDDLKECGEVVFTDYDEKASPIPGTDVSPGFTDEFTHL